MQSLEELRTPHLLLQRPRPADFDDIAAMYIDPVVMATLGGVRTRQQSRAYFDRLLAHWERHGFGWWIVRDLATGRFAGRGGLHCVVFLGRDEVEVGYGFLSEFWGRGLATELARESARVGFEVLGLPDLVSFTLPANRASRRVMEKVGFLYERDGLHADLPHVFYRLTAARWRELAPAPAGRDRQAQ
jgi:RimJ/RimL family protein N-acetyltransferase